jgi:hypothetical protein
MLFAFYACFKRMSSAGLAILNPPIRDVIVSAQDQYLLPVRRHTKKRLGFLPEFVPQKFRLAIPDGRIFDRVNDAENRRGFG